MRLVDIKGRRGPMTVHDGTTASSIVVVQDEVALSPSRLVSAL